MQFPTRLWDNGVFLADVDCGRLGTVTVTGGRYYGAEEIMSSLGWQHGERFDYARVHGDLSTSPSIRSGFMSSV